MPMLILHGGTDAIVSVDQARRLARANDRAELVVYPDRGHELVVDGAVQDRIAGFLEKLPRPR
jgi:pimeloyl-ACP methyl ester carboxylesterase